MWRRTKLLRVVWSSCSVLSRNPGRTKTQAWKIEELNLVRLVGAGLTYLWGATTTARGGWRSADRLQQFGHDGRP